MNKNRFDGLQFRIMETLEQAKGVPLTAREIADRLHSGEYKDQLLDTVIFRVTTGVHAMVGRGKLTVAEARGVGGQLAYCLPQRMKFPAVNSGEPPANPVLKPEIAEQIKTVEPPEPGRRKRVIHASGVMEAVVDLLDKAPHALAVPEVVEALKHMYPQTYQRDLTTTFAGHLYELFKRRRIKRVSASGRVPRVQYEYFTPKTGKHVPKPVEKKPLPELRGVVIPEKPARLAAKPVVFRPVAPPKAADDSIVLLVSQEKFRDINLAAKRFGVPIEEFCMQAIDFAMSYTEGS